MRSSSLSNVSPRDTDTGICSLSKTKLAVGVSIACGKHLILFAGKPATPWVWPLMIPTHNRVVSHFDTHLVVLHSALSPNIKHVLSGSIVDIHENDSCGFGILFCSCGDTRPLDARRSAAPPPPPPPPPHAHTVDNGCGFPTAWPRSLSNNKWFFHVYALHERPFRTGTLVPDLFSRTDYFCLSICAPCRML